MTAGGPNSPNGESMLGDDRDLQLDSTANYTEKARRGKENVLGAVTERDERQKITNEGA